VNDRLIQSDDSEKTQTGGYSKRKYTISEFRREVGLPLVITRKLLLSGMVEVEHLADGTIGITTEELGRTKDFLKNPWTRARIYFRALGPGLITGASDDDPSGIATYSSVGAAFGYSLIWLAIWLLPLMTAVQETCARIGIVTNHGLANVLKRRYHKVIVLLIVLLLIIANVVNIGADLGAMASALQLLWDINFTVAAIIFAVVIILIEVLVPYHLYSKILKWLTISVFAYVATGFIIHPEWLLIFQKAIVPSITFDKAYIFAIVAVFGTTITPYLFFWQTSEEVEEKNELNEDGVVEHKLNKRIGRMRTDVKSGMFLANLVFFFIILTTAKVLNQNGVTNIETAQDAAMALKPLAGNQAFLLFALGIIGTGLLAVPILAGSGAYALAELMNWKEGLEKKFTRARSFYLIIVFSIIMGLAFNFIGIPPMKALYYSAFLNGVIAVPLMYVIMVVGDDKKIMGRETNPLWVKFFGWMAFGFAAIAVLVMIVLNFR